MYWDYSHVSSKFRPEIRDRWTLKEIIEETAALGDEVYLIDAVSGRSYSYRESDRIASRMANALLGLGLRKGDRVALYLPNRPETVFLLFAVAKAGLVEVPLNPALRVREIRHILEISGARLLVAEDRGEVRRTLQELLEQASPLEHAVFLDAESPPRLSGPACHGLEKLLEQASDRPPQVDVQESDTYALFFTSGTTGLPKGAPLSHRTFLLAAQSVCAIPPIDGGSRNYTSLPLYHANAQLYSMTAMRCLGASLVLSDRFSPSKFWQEIDRHQATYFNSIGGMMQILDAAFAGRPAPRHSARFVFVGGTPRSLWERFEDKFGVTIFEGYSMTEAPVLFGNFHPDAEQRSLGSFGRPVFPDLGRSAEVLDEQGRILTEGTGELVQSGRDFVIPGYWKAPQADAEAFDPEGRFHSGDIVRKDSQGCHYYVDRKKFMIRVAGENVSAFEVEAAVNAYPGIELSAAVPVPDPIREEEIKVFLKLGSGVEAIEFAELLRHCAQRLAPFKVPRYFEVLEEFPRTATERIQKMQLKEREQDKPDHGWDRNRQLPDWKRQFYGG